MLKDKLKDGNKCVICKQEFEGFGNNPSPIENSGRCCDTCNAKYVIPARLKQAQIEKQLNTKDSKEMELKDGCVIDIPDLGEFTDEAIQDSVVSSWKQLFNELVDEGEDRIDRIVGGQRGKTHPDVILKEVTPTISNYLSGIKESLARNIESVAKYLVGFVKKHYAVKDEDTTEEVRTEVTDAHPEIEKLYELGKVIISDFVKMRKPANKRVQSSYLDTNYYTPKTKEYEKGCVIASINWEIDSDNPEDGGFFVIETYIQFRDKRWARIGTRSAASEKDAKYALRDLLVKASKNIK